jgi:hypothetical protein
LSVDHLDIDWHLKPNKLIVLAAGFVSKNNVSGEDVVSISSTPILMNLELLSTVVDV